MIIKSRRAGFTILAALCAVLALPQAAAECHFSGLTIEFEHKH